MGDLGDRAERIAEERIRAALPADARCYANVRFIARTRPTGPAHDGEADLVVVHPEHGLLVIEVKAGEPSRDASGRWFTGDRLLARSPFRQAEAAKHDLVARDRPSSSASPATTACGPATPSPSRTRTSPACRRATRSSARTRGTRSSSTPPRWQTPPRPGSALERAWAWWTGDGSRGHPLTQQQLDRIDEYLAPTVALHRLIRRDVEDGRDRLLEASRAQQIVLNQNRSKRRLEIVGPAGSGKSLVAVERARRLAREGYRTLFVCFNQPLATAVLREIEEDGEPADRRPVVTTFHRLCETPRARRPARSPPKPAGALPREWWDATLPAALDAAIDALPAERFHAVVIDEGQDFEPAWLTSLRVPAPRPGGRRPVGLPRPRPGPVPRRPRGGAGPRPPGAVRGLPLAGAGRGAGRALLPRADGAVRGHRGGPRSP